MVSICFGAISMIFVLVCYLSRKSQSLSYIVFTLYSLSIVCGSLLVLVNVFNDNKLDIAISIIAICVAVLPIIKFYFELINRKGNILHANMCVSIILSVILVYATIYSAIEICSPGSFSGITSTHWVDRTIDFLYFSVTTFTTVGFGDIKPETTLARFFVTIEILVAFVMLVLAVNFFVSKKDNLNTEEEKDEKKFR